MAISATHYQLLKLLKCRGVLPQGGSILEIGQANFYGDFDAATIADDLPEDGNLRQLLAGLVGLGKWDDKRFEIVSFIYKAMFSASSVMSIDMDPNAPRAHKLDLNGEVLFPSGEKFDTSYNHGTAEHIFNIAQVFRTMHDWTKAGGLMIHESPFTGWIDHGFYCLQPTLFYDLAQANGYKLEMVAIEHLQSRTYFEVDSRERILEAARRDQLPNNAMLFVAMRKVGDQLFCVPMQGVYSNTASEETKQAWMELR